MPLNEIVHIIDDDEGVRQALCALLDAKGYAFSSHASCEDFLNVYSTETTLCVVADLRLPGMGGLELQTRLIELATNLPLILITGHGDVSSAVRALKAGAADFIEKPIDGNLLLAAIVRAAALRRAQLNSSTSLALARERISNLTPRERDVLFQLVDGSSNKVIAHHLGISARTVENHRARLMDKMGAQSLAQLVHMALEAGTAINPQN